MKICAENQRAVSVCCSPKTKIEINENDRKLCVADELQRSTSSMGRKSYLLQSDVVRFDSGHRRMRAEYHKLKINFREYNYMQSNRSRVLGGFERATYSTQEENIKK